MDEKRLREIFLEEFGTEHPSEVMLNIALRLLNLEMVSEALLRTLVDKKIITQDEFEELLKEIAKKVNKQFEEFAKQNFEPPKNVN